MLKSGGTPNDPPRPNPANPRRPADRDAGIGCVGHRGDSLCRDCNEKEEMSELLDVGERWWFCSHYPEGHKEPCEMCEKTQKRSSFISHIDYEEGTITFDCEPVKE